MTDSSTLNPGYNANGLKYIRIRVHYGYDRAKDFFHPTYGTRHDSLGMRIASKEVTALARPFFGHGVEPILLFSLPTYGL